ncbi:MAG: 2-dehydropantoate 2-reductase [Chitinivibrionales bacterium]|nr:2-dehydropantoate 2-reductase [Chitinivibrionales bacterium]
MNRYIIYGAGAVGSAIGGLLARAGFDVLCVGRKDYCDALVRSNGIRMTILDREYVQPVRATVSIHPGHFSPETIVFMTVKANDTQAASDEIKKAVDNVPVVCWQNGVGNEDIIAREFTRVYGGVVRFTATMHSPGKTSFAGRGKLIIGTFPSGTDRLARSIASDLVQAGFTALTSDTIMHDKWLKLLVNLISCVRPITKKPPGESELRRKICRNLLSEGIAVLSEAGITARSTNGTEDSAEDMLQKFSDTLRLAEGEGQGMRLQNSTWQGLAKKKKELENDWYTGTIISLGNRHGVPTPYNRAVLDILHDIAAGGRGPESVEAETIIKKAQAIQRAGGRHRTD